MFFQNAAFGEGELGEHFVIIRHSQELGGASCGKGLLELEHDKGGGQGVLGVLLFGSKSGFGVDTRLAGGADLAVARLNAVNEVGDLNEDILLGFLELEFGDLLRCLAGAIAIPFGEVIQREREDYAIKIIRVQKAV